MAVSRRAGPSSSAAASAGPPYHLSIDGCLSGAIGTSGLTPAKLELWLRRLEPHLARLRTRAEDGTLPLLRLGRDSADIEAAEAAYKRLVRGAETVVFLGTGGSSLGGQTLAQLAGWNIPGDAGPERRKGPRTRFYDNLDARTLQRSLASLDLAATRFVVISKSGGTPETLVQLIAALGAVQKIGLATDIERLFLGLTEPAQDGVDNPLRRLCAHYAIPTLDHHPGIGGRFSALTNVGLLPALSRGLDIRAIRAGAHEVVEALTRPGAAAEFAPALSAAVAIGLMRERDVRTLVMLPYCDRLESFSAWWVQLWAESLGKQGQGSSPVGALGPLDQHSQMQLWMDGPAEHLITVLRTPSAGTGSRLDADLCKLAGLDMLSGRHAGDLVDAQAHAIPEALAQARRAVRAFDIPVLDERAMGALMMHFMIETILAAGLLGIDPFDQPAVELGTRLAKERLAAQG